MHLLQKVVEHEGADEEDADEHVAHLFGKFLMSEVPLFGHFLMSEVPLYRLSAPTLLELNTNDKRPPDCGTDGCQSPRKVDARLPGNRNSNTRGARPVHQIITMIKWIRTSRLSIKNAPGARGRRGGVSRGAASWAPRTTTRLAPAPAFRVYV